MFFTNYFFEHKGVKLSDYMNTADLEFGEAEEIEIHMKADKYDEKAARQHVQKIIDLLETPTILVQQSISQDHEEEAVAVKEGEMGPKEDKWKKSYDAFFDAIKAENENKQIPQPPANHEFSL